MATEQPDGKARIVVAGDLCLDVLGTPRPPRKSNNGISDNWRLTGEMRTHYLLGGSSLLWHFVTCAMGESNEKDTTRTRSRTVAGPAIGFPADLARGGDAKVPLPEHLLVRLSREEIVHSIIGLCEESVGKGKEKKTFWRVQQTHGFSGPDEGNPQLLPWIDGDQSEVDLLVLDDTGNAFRKDMTLWPKALLDGGQPVCIVHKLHSPLPNCLTGQVEAANDSKLWRHLQDVHHDHCVVIVDVNDLRAAGPAISRGLSWEKTALELVWHLRGDSRLAALRDCRQLIVRLGMDAALIYQNYGLNELPAVRLVYDPQGVEDGWRDIRKAGMVGLGSAFTAWVAASVNSGGKQIWRNDDEILRKERTDALTNAVRQGLAASRSVFIAGFGTAPDHAPSYPDATAFADLNSGADRFAQIDVPIFNHPLRADPHDWTILDSVFWPGSELEEAAERALKGASVNKLRQVPLGVFNALRTYDRFEIESYRSLCTIMREYLQNPAPARPLTIAVFGPPGSGKSFGVMQVAEYVRGENALDTPTFNLSQLMNTEELTAAFHLIRDSSVRGRVPLVFFDEFDASMGNDKLFWLKHFLAPMQDGLFMDRGTAHPIGKAIFVFAGGIFSRFKDFAIEPEMPIDQDGSRQQDKSNLTNQTRDSDRPTFKEFKDAKGPDFVSRLRARLDITGIEHTGLPTARKLFRRAAILRFQFKKKAPEAFDENDILQIDSGLARALLQVPKYRHGVRSMESILDMSRIAGCRHLNPACLPPPTQMKLHVDAKEFADLLGAPLTFGNDLNIIARAIHDDYLSQRLLDGTYELEERAHRPWEELDDDIIDSNREQARMIPIRLRSIKAYVRKPIISTAAKSTPLELSAIEIESLAKTAQRHWCAKRNEDGWNYGESIDKEHLKHPRLLEWNDPRLPEVAKSNLRNMIAYVHMHGIEEPADLHARFQIHVEILAQQEHERWMSEKLRRGWIYGTPRNDARRLHPCLVQWGDQRLSEIEKEKDRRTIRMIPAYLAAAAWEIVFEEKLT